MADWFDQHQPDWFDQNSPTPSVPKAGNRPPLPPGLQGPPQTRTQRVLQALPYSTVNAVERMTRQTPGVPQGGYTHAYGPADLRQDWENIKGIPDAISKWWASDPLTNDPAGSLLTAAQVGKGGYATGTSPIGQAAWAGTKAAAPDVGMGTARAAYVPAAIAAADYLTPGASKFISPLSSALVGTALHPSEMAKGFQQIGRGIRKGASAAKASWQASGFPPAEQTTLLGPARNVPPAPADTSNVNVTTGEPLSYPGPRQITGSTNPVVPTEAPPPPPPPPPPNAGAERPPLQVIQGDMTRQEYNRLRALLSEHGSLGFNSTSDAVSAIGLNQDWMNRWDIDPARSSEEAELGVLGNKMAGWPQPLQAAQPIPLVGTGLGPSTLVKPEYVDTNPILGKAAAIKDTRTAQYFANTINPATGVSFTPEEVEAMGSNKPLLQSHLSKVDSKYKLESNRGQFGTSRSAADFAKHVADEMRKQIPPVK